MREFFNDHADAPLMYALGYALANEEREPLDFFLHSIFPPYPCDMPGGGDPGWLWFHELNGAGEDVVIVEVGSVLAPPDGIWNEYGIDKIRYEVRAALENYAFSFPSKLDEISAILSRFNLEIVDSPSGMTPIQPWKGSIPTSLVLNKCQ